MCKNLHKTLRLSSFLSFMLSLLHMCTHQTVVEPFIYVGCSPNKLQPDSPFEANLNSLLSPIVSPASQSSYNSFGVDNDTQTPVDAAAYKLYQRRGDMNMGSSANYVRNAVGQIGLMCTYSNGARLELDGCYVRYENANFLGKHDTTLVHKKCNLKTSNEDEFLRCRDDVLADLQGGIGLSVSILGLVEGIAQCIGDLNSGDCSTCLLKAVGKLKNLCGSATIAEVYLSQCYTRYWASGYYSNSGSYRIPSP